MAKFYFSIFFFIFCKAVLAGNPIAFKENKGQMSDQNYKPRPDILFSANDGRISYHFKKNGLSYQLNKVSIGQICVHLQGRN
jgi:hypothetical protein